MRAVDVKGETGPATALYINENIDTPEPLSGELLIRVKAFGLNRMDLLQREGKYPVPPQAPKIIGVEFSGTVETVGSSVTDFKKGDRVFGLAYGGAYAEFIVVSQKMCIHKPEKLSFETAAGVPENWITATQALWTVGGFKPGFKVLMHAGASGVGIAVVQLAVAHGAEAVYVTASSEQKIKFCKTLGATEGFNYKTQDFAREILKATGGHGVDLIIDPVGQSHLQKDLNCAAQNGTVVVLGMMSGFLVKELDIRPILLKRIRIEGTTLRSRDVEYQKSLRDKFVEEALQSIADGKLSVPIEKVFRWEDVIDAHKLLESNQTQGKIICTI